MLLLGAAPTLEIFFFGVQSQVNQVQYLIERSGHWAIVFILLSVAITPARAFAVRIARLASLRFGKRLSDWNWLIAQRHTLGLWGFYYSTMHLGIYLMLEFGGELYWAFIDIIDRPFVTIGTIAYVMLIPLAITSNDFAMRRLKKNWKRIHRLTYVSSSLAVCHVVLVQKLLETEHLKYTIPLVILLSIRLYSKVFKGAYRHDDGDVAFRH